MTIYDDPNHDFENWLSWYCRQNDIPAVTIEFWQQAKKAYDAFYSCECHSCKRRKELGYMPVRLSDKGCTAPIGGSIALSPPAQGESDV